jgi:hydroxymethylglutaryl-CoA lyase
MNLSQDITIIEVGPRDGLQNERSFVPTACKVELINLLAKSGLKQIEVTSFVSPKAIPQLADNEAVLTAIDKHEGVTFSALVPNEQGIKKAISLNVKKIAIFTAASESFNQRNINCTIAESIERFTPIIKLARENKIEIRAYISCVLGCPYEGNITARQVADVTERLLKLGVDELSLGDTIGVGTPKQTKELIKEISSITPISDIAMHFHDTYGQAVANTYASLECGINRFDSSVAGLGGCPYAQGASGNVA